MSPSAARGSRSFLAGAGGFQNGFSIVRSRPPASGGRFDKSAQVLSPFWNIFDLAFDRFYEAGLRVVVLPALIL